MPVLYIQKDLIKRLYSLLTIKESAASVPKNLEARRRLQFFTNSLFMQMPVARPASEMFSFRWDSFRSSVAPFTLVSSRFSCYVRFCLWFSYSYTNGGFTLLCSVFTPYYSEIVLYSMNELQKKNEDGITTLFYLQKIYPGLFFPLHEQFKQSWSMNLENVKKYQSRCNHLRHPLVFFLKLCTFEYICFLARCMQFFSKRVKCPPFAHACLHHARSLSIELHGC